MKIIRAAALAGASVLSCVPLASPATATNFPTKLFLSQDGIALSKFPSRKVVRHTIVVDRTKGHAAANWTATSDQPWLSVTPSGVTGGKLTVNAATAGLAKNQLLSANVTVTTADADFTDTETLHVGLWIGSTDPQTVEVSQNATSIAANPVTPIAYVSDGSSSVFEYNVYSGTLVGTLKKVAPTIGYMEVSSDGATLFVSDTTNYRIVALDAETGNKLGTYSVGYPLNDGFDIAYARPYGQPALYIAGGYPSPDGKIIAYPSGETLASGIAPTFLAVTPDGRRVFSITTYEEPSTIFGYSVKLANDKLSLVSTVTAGIEGENCQDLAISHDGKHVYPACGAPYEFDVYSGTTGEQVQTLPAQPYPNNIDIDENDNVIGGIDGLYEAYDVYVYNQKGFSLGNVPTTPESEGEGQQTDAMKASGDGTRVISATGAVYNQNQTLMFRNLP